jgi:glutamate 5-kinase
MLLDGMKNSSIGSMPAAKELPDPRLARNETSHDASDFDEASLERRLALKSAKRIVIKVGSTLIIDPNTGLIRYSWLNQLAEDIRICRACGQEVSIVSSGAVAVGRHYLSFPEGTLRPAQKQAIVQAAASAGQVILTRAFHTAFDLQGIPIGQILLTPDDTEIWDRHLNTRLMLNQLLALSTVPLINENNATTCDGVRFGDNDRLSARISQMLRAGVLIILSDVDGLYTSNPRADPNAQHLSAVEEITPEILAMAGAAGTRFSSGGMITKLVAAQIAMNAGCHAIIANGTGSRPLTRIIRGAKGTWFKAHSEPRTNRKAWIAGALKTAGAVIVDEGACNALRRGKSLLPAGIIAVEGGFGCGDIIVVRNRAGAELARGITAYSSQEAELIAGHRSHVFEHLLGFKGPDELIHRDDLVLLGARI